MYNSDVDWFNLPLYFYKDEDYDSDGSLRASATIGLSNNTFKNPKLSIQIQNGPLMKSVQFGFNDIYLLLLSVKQIESGSPFTDSDENTIYQRIGKNQFIIKYGVANQAKIQHCVKIQIYYNESDFSLVIMSKFEYRAFLSFLSSFKDNFFTVFGNLMSNAYMSKMSDVLDEINRNQKGIMGGLSTPKQFIKEPELPETSKNAQETAHTIEELDKFMGPNQENIKIDEIDEKSIERKKPVEQVSSAFVESYLKNDIMNFETKINVLAGGACPIIDFANDLKIKIHGEDSKISYLPSINGDDLKSICYMSKLFCSVMEIEYYNYNKPISSSLPILTYIPIDGSVQDHDLDLAYDLLLIQGYVKMVKRRVEGKSGVDEQNKKDIYYTRLRFYTDVFVHGMLKTKSNQIESIILKRFKYFKSVGVFERYEQLMKDLSLAPISEGDIQNFMIQYKTVSERVPPVSSLHSPFKESNGLFLDYNNQFSLEQITNEIIRLEVEHRLGKDLTKSDILDPIIKKYDITPEIVAEFLKFVSKNSENKQPKADTIPYAKDIKVKTFIEKFVNQNKSLISDEIQADFIKYIENLNKNEYDFEKFDIEKIDFEIVKALYVWNSDRDDIKNYRDFLTKIKDVKHDTKDSLINAMKIKETKEDESMASALDMLID